MAYSNNTCKVEGCTNAILHSGICSIHYQRLRRHGSTESLKPRDKVCSVEGCNKKHFGNGLCNTHLSKKWTTPEYKSWIGMKSRCNNENDPGYTHYGGRGIQICSEWRHDYKAFYNYMGDKPTPKHSIDRINVNGNYEPGNVRWANAHTQNANTTANVKTVGVNKSYKGWTARLVVNRKEVLSKRFKKYSDAVESRKQAEELYAVYI